MAGQDSDRGMYCSAVDRESPAMPPPDRLDNRSELVDLISIMTGLFTPER